MWHRVRWKICSAKAKQTATAHDCFPTHTTCMTRDSIAVFVDHVRISTADSKPALSKMLPGFTCTCLQYTYPKHTQPVHTCPAIRKLLLQNRGIIQYICMEHAQIGCDQPYEFLQSLMYPFVIIHKWYTFVSIHWLISFISAWRFQRISWGKYVHLVWCWTWQRGI